MAKNELVGDAAQLQAEERLEANSTHKPYRAKPYCFTCHTYESGWLHTPMVGYLKLDVERERAKYKKLESAVDRLVRKYLLCEGIATTNYIIGKEALKRAEAAEKLRAALEKQQNDCIVRNDHLEKKLKEKARK